MCLKVRRAEYLRTKFGKTRFRKDSDGNFIAYKVVSEGNTSPFAVARGYQYQIGYNDGHVRNRGLLAGARQLDQGLHLFAKRSDAYGLIESFKEHSSWALLHEDVSFKVIRVFVAPEDVLGIGTFGLFELFQDRVGMSCTGCTVKSLDYV